MAKKSALARGPTVSLFLSLFLSCFQLQDGRLYVIGRVISGRSRSKLLSGHPLPDMYKENCKSFRKEAKRLLLNSLRPKPGRTARSETSSAIFQFLLFLESCFSTVFTVFRFSLSLSLSLSLSPSPSLFRYTPLCLPSATSSQKRRRNGKVCVFIRLANLSHSTITAGKSVSQSCSLHFAERLAVMRSPPCRGG